MESERFTVGNRGYCALVSEFNRYLMVHIRKFYEEKPSKYGIALTTKEWRIMMKKSKQLNNLIEQMQEALEQAKKCDKKEKEELESESFHVGFRGFYTMVSEFRGELYVHIRKFDDDGKPTTKGVALNMEEWNDLQKITENIAQNISHMQESKQEPPAKKQCTEHSNVKHKRRLFKAQVN